MADGAVTDYPGVTVAIARGVIRTQWTNWAGTTTGLPLVAPAYPDKTVSVHGTWGGATFVLQGSSDGTNYYTLNDTRGQGNAISLTADEVATVLENVEYLRGQTTGGTGTSLTVTVTSKTSGR